MIGEKLIKSGYGMPKQSEQAFFFFFSYRGCGWIFEEQRVINSYYIVTRWAGTLNKDQSGEVPETTAQLVFEKQGDNFKPMLYE